MKVVGMMVVGSGEGDRWLEQVLTNREKLVDDMVVCLNNPDKKTEKLVKKSGFWNYRDDREWGIYQPRIKSDLLKKIGKLKPDWILPSDADEFYGKHFTREEAEKLANSREIGYYFAIINLWGDNKNYRHDLSFWNVRYYNYKETAKYGLHFERKNVHCGLAPPVVYKMGIEAPFLVKHYGLMLEKDRQEKVKRYEKYDSNAVFKGRDYYDKLKENKFIREFNEDEMQNRIIKDVETHGRKIKK